jgi:hypothetical protein
VLLRDEVLRLRSLSLDGRTGMPLIQYGAETFGLSQALQLFQGRLLKNGASMGGVFEHPGAMSEDAQARFRASVMEINGGIDNAGKFLIAEEGMKYQPLRLSPIDIALMDQVQATREEICTWFGVIPHLAQMITKEGFMGSGNLEELLLQFLTMTVQPDLERVEQAVNRDVIGLGTGYYAEHNPAALQKSTTENRYKAYALAAGGAAPWLSRAEIRKAENRPAIAGTEELLQPLNMGGAGDTEKQAQRPPARTRPNAAHYRLLHDAAARLVRREVARVQTIAKHTAADPEAWLQELDAFYAEHTATVAATLHVPRDVAARYCADHTSRVRARGIGVMDDWETTRVAALVDVALEQHEQEAA